MCKQMSSKPSKVTDKLIPNKTNIYKKDLALNTPQGLVCHEAPTNLQK